MENYYQILEVTQQATFAQIKSSYKALCQQYHPDKLPPDTPEKAKKYIEERFKQLNEAYSTLSDPVKRKEYDYLLKIDNSQGSYSPQPETYTMTTLSSDKNKLCLKK
jgi:curved DNA-binding protein CbpA